ncbi:tRNA epoxyqueuosine(34) reductase QueG [Aureibacter tunicatorum]|uniref:Epoxyqueuosine reductase n=1 Tax=Aureibacter tunicatorum TaxID=866807 RepID=A0AAE3XLH0_9BACT|nr:tRNA epoxyqueuosine(34) reductase QueG [Aureibacter tunicatorum]MDR6238685.1 epoxyqueuosine reductase [Aureibacter tunicatorum]BDD05384.1 epoxyqueuosine reductase [Aureibacter tunicatorum]
MNKYLSSVEDRTAFVKRTALDLGFQFCGISKAEFLEEDAAGLEQWLKNGSHGKMSYMENHFDKRLDPTKLVEGARSVVTLMYNYYPHDVISDQDNYKIAKYAYGKDYHFVIKDKLKEFMELIHENVGEVDGRVFVDSAPVMERSWAKKSGVGWVGKNTLLINKSAGSFFFLCEMIIDLELEPDGPIKDYCGTCNKCVEACPTDALVGNGVMDASKCISYLTIELKDSIPNEFEGQMEDWVFGCDICQDVCPWNRFSKPHNEPMFKPHENLVSMRKNDWEELTRDVFNEIFRKSAVKRTKIEGLARNIAFAKKKGSPK